MVTHYCIECGEALIAGAQFCENCGREAGSRARPIAKPFSLVAKIEVCPKCGQGDRVTKVSGIVGTESRQKQQRRLGDSDRHPNAVLTSTELASQLTLSEPYKYGRPFRTGMGFLAVLLFASSPFVAVATISTLAGESGPNFGTILLFPLTFIVAILIAIMVGRVAVLRDKNKVGAEGERWRKRKSGWDKLYYCYRDDLIFSDGRSAPRLKMLEFLDE